MLFKPEWEFPFEFYIEELHLSPNHLFSNNLKQKQKHHDNEVYVNIYNRV